MNAARRKAISALLSRAEELRSELESIASDEREAFNAMPEGLQQSDRGQASEAAADALDSAVSSLEEVESYLDEAKAES